MDVGAVDAVHADAVAPAATRRLAEAARPNAPDNEIPDRLDVASDGDAVAARADSQPGEKHFARVEVHDQRIAIGVVPHGVPVAVGWAVVEERPLPRRGGAVADAHALTGLDVDGVLGIAICAVVDNVEIFRVVGRRADRIVNTEALEAVTAQTGEGVTSDANTFVTRAFEVDGVRVRPPAAERLRPWAEM